MLALKTSPWKSMVCVWNVGPGVGAVRLCALETLVVDLDQY